MAAFVKPHAAESFHQNFVSNAKKFGNSFRISEPSENLLRVSMMQSSWMMEQITMADVAQATGQAVSVGDNSLYTGRTLEGRFRSPTKLDGTAYDLIETDSCAGISYDKMSLLINSGSGTQEEFNQKMSEFFSRAFTLDMLKIGFNGQRTALDTKPDENPKGEDVNRGWHTIAREFNAGSQVITKPASIGDAGDFKHIDALASFLINELIPEGFREDPHLVVMVGAELAASQRLKIFNGAALSSERAAAQMLNSSVAGRFAFVPPFMPGRRLVITTLDNLHIYTQKDSRIFKAGFNEDKKIYEHSYLRQEGYALGDGFMYAAMDENALTLKDA